MKLSRETTLILKYLIDEFIPPIIRDSRIFMYFPFKLLFGDKSNIFHNFKTIAPSINDKAYREIYKEALSKSIKRDTDLNKKSLKAILDNVKGISILDVGCGNGYLSKILAKKFKVTACDINIDKMLKKDNSDIHFVNANITNAPFKNRQFDTVICAHTIEHVLDLNMAINELRRVTKKRLIIVTPRQRPYKYTFDLHLHFFPYPHSLKIVMGNIKNSTCSDVGGDLFYMEDR
jgi:ubiquinone/menaquinone biosynthesis C-methylase UbiE